MNLRTPGFYCTLGAAVAGFGKLPAFANTSPADIQAAVDAGFGPWETINIDQRGNVFDEAWRKNTSFTLDGGDAAIAIMVIDGH